VHKVTTNARYNVITFRWGRRSVFALHVSGITQTVPLSTDWCCSVLEE